MSELYVIDTNITNVSARVGDTFSFELSKDGIGGYLWFGVIENPDVLKFESSEPIKAASVGPTIYGDGVTTVFKYRAIGKGKSKITFVKNRPWSKEGSEIRYAEVRIL